MSDVTLAFLSPSRCEQEARASPLRRALAGADPEVVADLSATGKVELRGDLDLVQRGPADELVRHSPRRGLLLTTDDPVDAVARIRADGVLAYDVSGALAGLAVTGARVMRRLTDLELEQMPAAGPFAHVPAVIVRDEGERFRVYVAQELAHYVAEAVLDALEGLEPR